MPYKTEFTHCGSHLSFRSTGQRTRDDSYDLWKSFADKVEETGCLNVLSILHLEGRMPVTDYLIVMRRIAAWDCIPWLKVAVVDHQQQSKPDCDLASALGHSFQLNARAFNSEKLATDWLQSS